MKDSVLKKEFKASDVQRMRNLITGKQGDKTKIQTGYDKQSTVHKEGDVWEEGGKEWTIKNGIKQTVTKLDTAKQLARLPLTCPSCNQPIKSTLLNKKMWTIHQKCFDCVIEMEAEIKRSGNWESYEKGLLNANKNQALNDLETALDEWVDTKDTYVTEQGDVESWEGGNKQQIYKEVKEKIAELKKLDIYNGQNT